MLANTLEADSKTAFTRYQYIELNILSVVSANDAEHYILQWKSAVPGKVKYLADSC